MKTNENLKEFVKNENDIRSDLNPRDALFGGRTNSSVLYYKVENDEKIMYRDFTSVSTSNERKKFSCRLSKSNHRKF